MTGRVRCNFCVKEMGGGIYSFKEHLAWVKGNFTCCKEVPAEVKQQMLKLITEGKGKMEENQESEFEAQMERIRIASLQEHNYRQIEIQEMYRRRDNASSSHQPQEHVIPGRGGRGPSLLRSTYSRLRRNLSNHPSSYNFYPQVVTSITEAGLGLRGPTAKELAESCLEAVVHDVNKHIAQFKVCWLSTGVTIMTEGWKDKSHRYLVNFLIGFPRGIVYHSSIDLSRKRHTHLNKIIDEVGPEIVVQVVTDNAANYRKADLLLMESYWTPCAAHCVNLMLKEIGKLRRVKTCILKSKLISRFIYNHTFLHALMREHCTFWARCNNVVSVTEPLVRVLRLRDSDDKLVMGFLFDAMRRAMEAILDNNIWTEEILEIVDHRWRDQYHGGGKNCIYRLEHDIETQMESQWWTIHGIRTKQLQKIAVRILSQTCAALGYYTSINLDYIFRRDLPHEWVSLRTPLLDQDFLSGAVADMNDNVDVAASNGDMTMDKDHDYTQDENEAQDDKETDGTMENNWREPVIQEFRQTAPVCSVLVQTAPSPKTV
ncbi:hypothetical protein AMTRI_Chr03g49760 [Amborella trichopoda]